MRPMLGENGNYAISIYDGGRPSFTLLWRKTSLLAQSLCEEDFSQRSTW